MKTILRQCAPFFSTLILLITFSCATKGCLDKVSHRDGIILTDYATIITTGEIKPGDPGESEFFETLTDDGDDLMPPSPYSPLYCRNGLMMEFPNRITG